jgi:hypothetical protein
VDERRKVERHLIGCVDCRDRRESSTGAFSALRAFAEVSSPVPENSPSLWPALSTQIRQSRHVSSAPSWWEIPLPGARAALGLSMSLIAIAIAPLALLSGRTPARPAPASVSVEVQPVEFPKLASVPPALPAPGPSIPVDAPLKKPKPVNLGFDPTSNASVPINYDLDHGTPRGSGSRDPQHSY